MTNWAAAIVDMVIIISATALAIAFKNGNFLWLIILIFFTGSYRESEKTPETHNQKGER